MLLVRAAPTHLEDALEASRLIALVVNVGLTTVPDNVCATGVPRVGRTARVESAVDQICQREIGHHSPPSFAIRDGCYRVAYEGIVVRLCDSSKGIQAKKLQVLFSMPRSVYT